MDISCRERTTTCTGIAGVNAQCSTTSEFEEALAIAPPTVEGATVTWEVTFDGPLAEYAADHAVGDVLQAAITIVGPSWGPVPGLALFGCTSDLGCAEPVGDLVLGSGTFTIDEQG